MTGMSTTSRTQLPRINCSVKLRDRLREIASRTNLPVNEVILRLIRAGLDATQDMALTQRED